MQIESKIVFYGLIISLLMPLYSLAAEPGSDVDPNLASDQAKILDSVMVWGRGIDAIGINLSASQGTVGYLDFEFRPLLRTGEILETIPGVIATQHSGEGKANQFFLRGFNLDHGTDFAGLITEKARISPMSAISAPPAPPAW